MSDLYPWQLADWRRLQELRERLPHGVLIKGGKGIGKLDMAKRFAQSLLCQSVRGDGSACDGCPSCHWFSQGSHPDFRLIEPDAISQEGEESESGKKPSKEISVEQIRALADFVGMSAHQGGKRIVIIHPAEAMNGNAANALLKSLEEPPTGLIFLLISHKPQQLLPTILSRCLSFTVAAPDHQAAVAWLKTQDVKEAELALATSGYAPLLAVNAESQTGSEARDKLLRALSQSDGIDAFGLAESLQKTELVLIVQWLQQWSYDLISMRLAGKVRYFPAQREALKKQAAALPPLALAALQKNLLEAKRESRHTLNPKLFLENLFISYQQSMRN